MEKIESYTAKTTRGTELTYLLESGSLKVQTPGGIATVQSVFAPHKNEKVVIKIDENGADKTVDTSYEDAQMIKTMLNAAQKSAELYSFSDHSDFNAQSDFNSFGMPFQISDNEFLVYKHNC